MASEQTDIAGLLGSRICHDLISPIGAIGNGLELIGLSGSGGSAEMALINESVTNASARIRFYRIAFGSASDDQQLSRPEILNLLRDLTASSRLSIDWQAAGEVHRAEAKLLFLLLQCCEAALPYGGTITVSRDGGSWRLAATGRKIRDLGDFWLSLTDPLATVSITPHTVQFGLVRPSLDDTGRRLSIQLSETGITLDL